MNELRQAQERLAHNPSNLDKPHLMRDIPPGLLELIYDYYTLACLSRLDEAQSKRIDEILGLATKNNLLNFWISEVDHLIGHRLGLLDEFTRASIENQKALLREYLGINPTCQNIPLEETSSVSISTSLPSF